MSHIAVQLQAVRALLQPQVRLVAVSKTYPPDAVNEAYAHGQRIFGENKVQEMVDKHSACPSDIEWHLIGHLQTNKVKYIAPFVNMIHSVDSLRLLMEINKRAEQNNRIIHCLLQVFIASEETKFGLSPDECLDLISSRELNAMHHVRIVGLMGMATLTDDRDQIRKEFKGLKNLFDRVKSRGFANDEEFRELSMGMSSDMDIAMEEGSTLVRVGTAIFGKRN